MHRPSRALIQESIFDKFISDATERTKQVVQGNPLDSDTMIGAQASKEQLDKILSYIQIGQDEGARLCGGERVDRVGTCPAATRGPDDLRGQELDANLPGGDLRPGGLGDNFGDF